eukprot:m.235638 g.235638  ORF g.235638 m.235638 type:complete len:132 (+) comp33667_c0_seq1:321-716(+)
MDSVMVITVSAASTPIAGATTSITLAELEGRLLTLTVVVSIGDVSIGNAVVVCMGRRYVAIVSAIVVDSCSVIASVVFRKVFVLAISNAGDCVSCAGGFVREARVALVDNRYDVVRCDAVCADEPKGATLG